MTTEELKAACERIIRINDQLDPPRIDPRVWTLACTGSQPGLARAFLAQQEALRVAGIALQEALPEWDPWPGEGDGLDCSEITNADVRRMRSALARIHEIEGE